MGILNAAPTIGLNAERRIVSVSTSAATPNISQVLTIKGDNQFNSPNIVHFSAQCSAQEECRKSQTDDIASLTKPISLGTTYLSCAN
jgi:hypothetical protein